MRTFRVRTPSSLPFCKKAKLGLLSLLVYARRSLLPLCKDFVVCCLLERMKTVSSGGKVSILRPMIGKEKERIENLKVVWV